MHKYIDEVVCFIALSSTTFSAYEDDGVVTICLDLLSRDVAVDVSVQLETVTGSGTATGIKYNRACICHNTVIQYHLQYSIYIEYVYLCVSMCSWCGLQPSV